MRDYEPKGAGIQFYNFQGILTVFSAKQDGYNCFFDSLICLQGQRRKLISWLVFIGTFFPQVRITLVESLL